MLDMFTNFFDEHPVFSIVFGILSLLFIVFAFVVSTNVRSAQAQEAATRAEANKPNEITIYENGNPVKIQVGYKIADMVPGFKTQLTCTSQEGKKVIDEFLPMGSQFKNNPQHITSINNKGNRIWIITMGQFICVEEELRDKPNE